MEWLLEKEDLWDVISVARPEPETEAWKNRDRKARANIGLFLDESQFKLVKNSDSARGMWNALKEHHEKATMSTVVHYLNQLCSANMSENGDMEEHLNAMEDLFDKLIAAGQNLDESLQIAMIFRSVPPSYRSLVQSLQCRADADWTVALVKARLLDEYNQRRERSDVLSNDMKAMKLDASEKRTEKLCYFCKQPGHFRKHCKKLQSMKNTCGDEKKQQHRKDDNHRGGNPKAKQAHDAAGAGAGGSVCFMAGDAMPDCWVIDSGATRHMTSDRSFFKSMDDSDNSRVTLADGNKTKVCGVGEGVVFGENGRGERVEVTLKNVLYVPGLDGGLISVSQLAAKGFVAKFGASSCEILNANGESVVVGDKVSNLYRLRIHDRSLKVSGEHHERCQHTWHRRTGHRDPDVLRRIEADELVSGFDLHDCGARIVCECCLKGKLARKPFPPVTERKSSRPLDLVHTDLCGPMETATPSGNRYLMTVIDDYTRYITVYLLKKKSEAPGRIQQYVRWVENCFGRKPLVIRSDGGGEYVNRELQEFYAAEGIKAQYTTPYSPQQNGVAERRNRSLQEMAICMLADAGLGKLYWGEAVMTAAYLQNRLPSRVVAKTPFELWTGRKPSFEHLRVFGCDAYVHVPSAKRSKFDEKSVKLTFVGYSEDHKGYRFLDPTTNRVTISRDARFIELGNGSEQLAERKSEAVSEEDISVEIPIAPLVADRDAAEDDVSSDEFEGWSSADEESDDFQGFSDNEDNRRDEEEQTLNRGQRRTRGVLPSRYDDFVVGIAEYSSGEPTDYRKALEIPQWKAAMDSEIESHNQNGTWDLVRLPEGRKLIGSRWVFKLKRSETGDVVKHKARLVAQGYNQRYGIDYVDVFAPVTRQETLRALLAVAGKERMVLHHLDVKTAYLHGTIEEEIYMRQPPGYEVAGKEDMVCRVRRSIYGLKQSARCWNRALHAALMKLNFEQCESDPCLYVRRDGPKTVFLLVYVDDILVACKQAAVIDAVFEALRKEFDVTNLGLVKHFLGHEVRCNGGVYSLRLTSHIDALIEKFGLKDCNPSKSPMDPSYIKSDNNSKPFEDVTRYRSLVGALLYVAVNARPDVAASVSLLGRKVSNPSEMDWKAAKRVVRYLKGTKDLKLEFGPGQGWILEGYSDADWAGDQASRMSTSGYLFFFGAGPIAWVSHKQSCVSLSSMEAEYVALSEACQQLIWLRRLMEDFGQSQQCTTVYEDNQSCLSFVKAERTSKRSKHIDTKQHFIKDLVDQGVLKLEFCPSENMIADALTKPLGTTKFRLMLEHIGLSA